MQHNQSSYKPLILIFLYILIGTVLLRNIDPSSYMQNFMGLFFITFSYFKIINLNEFAVSFRQYDPIAKTITPYAKFYPFLELALGLAFLTSVLPLFTASITAVVTGIGAFGIYQAIKKQKIIECACLGAVFKLPLSKVSLFENIAMFLMSIFIILTMILI